MLFERSEEAAALKKQGNVFVLATLTVFKKRGMIYNIWYINLFKERHGYGIF